MKCFVDLGKKAAVLPEPKRIDSIAALRLLADLLHHYPEHVQGDITEEVAEDGSRVVHVRASICRAYRGTQKASNA